MRIGAQPKLGERRRPKGCLPLETGEGRERMAPTGGGGGGGRRGLYRHQQAARASRERHNGLHNHRNASFPAKRNHGTQTKKQKQLTAKKQIKKWEIKNKQSANQKSKQVKFKPGRLLGPTKFVIRAKGGGFSSDVRG